MTRQTKQMLVQDEAQQEGPLKDVPLKEGPLKDVPPKDGPREDSPTNDSPPEDSPRKDSPYARRGSVVGTFKAVAWAFLGIRARGAHEADIANLNPVHLIIVGVVCAAVFVTTLLFIVRWAVGSAG
jgi:hypothetical protein